MAPTSDSILALDLKTGKIHWAFHTLEKDVAINACGAATKSSRRLVDGAMALPTQPSDVEPMLSLPTEMVVGLGLGRKPALSTQSRSGHVPGAERPVDGSASLQSLRRQSADVFCVPALVFRAGFLAPFSRLSVLLARPVAVLRDPAGLTGVMPSGLLFPLLALVVTTTRFPTGLLALFLSVVLHGASYDDDRRLDAE
jgi:hypothetical protein